MKVLVTAGTVYGRLDDNKLVGNRIRGIWATKFAAYLTNLGHQVTLLLPDTFPKADVEGIRALLHPSDYPSSGVLTLEKQNGYENYAEQCYALAPKVDAAVMAAAVVNWIPKEPFKGKMPTDGFAEGSELLIPFILAPRVIDRMRKLNPKLTLVGCKMTSGATIYDLYQAAYQTLLKGHCNVVLANDLSNLKEKFLVYPDGSRVEMGGDFEQLYGDLRALFDDKFYRTDPQEPGYKDVGHAELQLACAVFDMLCKQYRERFYKRPDGNAAGPTRVFGSVAVKICDGKYLVSPREKGTMFDSKEAVVVTKVDRTNRIVHTVRGKKATLNAPLLVAVLEKYTDKHAVVHLHDQQLGWETLPYGPPGTVRDNDRAFTTPNFNVLGHGCVFAIDVTVSEI